MSQQINRLKELIEENSEYIVSIDANVNKTDRDVDIVLQGTIPPTYAYDFVDRLRHILEYADVYDKITFTNSLSSVNAVKFQVLPTVPQVTDVDLDSDGFPDIYEIGSGTDPYDIGDFPVSFFNIFRYI